MFQVKALAGRAPSSGSVAVCRYRRSRRRPGSVMPSVGDEDGGVGALPTVIVDRRRRACVFTPSETVSRAVYGPALVYVWEGLAAVDVGAVAEVPRDRSAAVPRGPIEPALEKLTVSGAGPEVGLADATATGGWLDGM